MYARERASSNAPRREESIMSTDGARRVSPPVAAERPHVEREEVVRRLGEPGLRLVNVLPREEFDQARIPGSISLPVTDLESKAAQVLPDRSGEVVVYCGGPG
jgi:hypothetical protein